MNNAKTVLPGTMKTYIHNASAPHASFHVSLLRLSTAGSPAAFSANLTGITPLSQNPPNQPLMPPHHRRNNQPFNLHLGLSICIDARADPLLALAVDKDNLVLAGREEVANDQVM